MREGALYALFSFAAVIGGSFASEADGDVPPRQKCDPSLSNHTIFDFSLPNVHQNGTLDLSSLRGKVTLIVNVATYWGYVVQYHGLNALKSQHGAEGLEVIGVPCSQFYLVSTLRELYLHRIMLCCTKTNTIVTDEKGLSIPVVLILWSMKELEVCGLISVLVRILMAGKHS